MMANMKKKYAEIVSKNGPLFMHLKYLERLNMEDSSLAKEKWTTELFERDVEVMPIIFEKDEDGQKDELQGQFRNENFTEMLPQTDNMAFPRDEQVDDKSQDLTKASGGKAWWINMNEDCQVDVFKQPSPLFPPPPSTECLKTYVENEPKSNPAPEEKMEIILEKFAEVSVPCGNEKRAIHPIEDPQSVEQHVLIAENSHQDVGTAANLLVASNNLGSLLPADKNEKSELKFPISDSDEKNILEIRSGRVARPLSGKYCLQVTDDNLLKRTTSVMDLPHRTDKSDLSTLYDELYAQMIEKKSKPFSRKAEIMPPLLELFHNPSFEKFYGEGSSSKKPTIPTTSEVGADSSHDGKKDVKTSRKRTHHDI